MKRKIFSILFALVLVCSFSLVTAVPAGAAAATFVLNGITFNANYGPDQGYVAYIQPYDASLNVFHSPPGQAIEQYGNPGDLPLGPWYQGAWFNFEYGKPFGGGETQGWAGQNYVVTYWWDRSVGDYVPINGAGGDIYIYQPEDGVRPMGILYQGVWRMFDAGTNGLSDVREADFWWDLSDAGVAEGDTIEALAWWSNALGFPGLLIEKKFPDDHKEQYAGPDALDMDGDGSTEPLTFVGGGSSMSYHDPFHMGIGNAAMIPPTEVWVDDDYFFGGGNDGHIWGLDAFAVIQDGIDAVAEAGTVNVLVGTYPEDVTIDKSLTLISAAGKDNTTIEAQGSGYGSAVRVQDGVSDVTIAGFTINGNAHEAGVYLVGNNSNITISNNVITAGSATGKNAILTGGGQLDITVDNNELISTHDAGQVLYINGEVSLGNASSNVDITNNTFKGHVGGGVLLGTEASGTIFGNDFTESSSTYARLELWVSGADVTDNIFEDTPLGTVQVRDGSGTLNMATVAEDNTFDRAVFIEDGNIIWSSIQDAVNVAVTGDTVKVADGTYTENVVIPLGKDNLQLIGDGSSVTSIEPASGRPVALSGNLGLIDGFTIKGFTLVTADANYAFIALSGTVGPPPYTTNLELEDVVVDGGIYGIGLNAVNGVTLTNVHLSNISGGGQGALEMTGVSNLLFTEGSIEDNAIGVRLQQSPIVPPYGPNGNIQIHFTNFCGNGIAIENLDSSTVIDATNNFWCDPSGPKHNPGYGDPVSGNVLFNPWLLEPFVPGAPPPTFDKTLALNIGWTLVSTDNWISAASVVGEGVVWALNYTPSLGWFEVTPADLVPVNALYLKMEEGGGLGFDYSGGVPIASSKNLEAGWNLISSATVDNARNVLSPLRYIDVGEEQGAGLATLVSQGPPLNHNSPSFYQSTVVAGDWFFALGQITLNPFDGYWVYMNAGKPFGVVPGAQSPVPPPPAP